MWFAENPSKRWAEIFFLCYSPCWIIALLCIVVPFQFYEVCTGRGDISCSRCLFKEVCVSLWGFLIANTRLTTALLRPVVSVYTPDCLQPCTIGTCITRHS